MFVRLKFFFSYSLLFICCLVEAQNPLLNAEKYQTYRERLLHGFMVSNSCNAPGTNIPASLRNIRNRQMRWGDATINLSNYMAVLATEFARLQKQGLPTEETLKELHYALLAMERLDADAGRFYGNPDEVYLPDGFFKRDDVPSTFTQDWAWKNPDFEDYPFVRSDYSDKNIFLNEMSQDQVWNLIIGLSLVSHLVDDESVYVIPEYHENQELTLSDRAALSSYRMIKAMQDKQCLSLSFFGKRELCLKYWYLRNPFTGSRVLRGANPNFLKFGFAESGNFITDYKFGDLHWGNSRKAGVWFEFAKMGQSLQGFVPGGQLEYMYYTATTATIGQVWSTRNLVRLFNRNKVFLFKAKPQYEHLALISCVLHNDCPKILDKEQSYYRNLLDIAPENGPFNYGNNLDRPYVYEWSSVNRFVWPQRRGEGTTNSYIQGEYNGLDYLLLYNLFWLVYEK